jgi:hypothetical protein
VEVVPIVRFGGTGVIGTEPFFPTIPWIPDEVQLFSRLRKAGDIAKSVIFFETIKPKLR